MYFIEKTFEVSGAHYLHLDYDSKCKSLHGHNWKIRVFCKAEELNENGMIIDFSHVKRIISETMDHKLLNEIFDFNPTAENIARWICLNIDNCYKVEIEESEGNKAIYEQEICRTTYEQEI